MSFVRLSGEDIDLFFLNFVEEKYRIFLWMVCAYFKYFYKVKKDRIFFCFISATFLLSMYLDNRLILCFLFL